MTGPTRLGADELRRAVTCYRDALRAHREAINRLNVYPVPDGDTGTNMALTVASVVRRARRRRRRPGRHLHRHQPRLPHGGPGQLGGDPLPDPARHRLRGRRRRGPRRPDRSRALSAAAEAAYGAVMRPVEGTILTVARESAEAATGAADGGSADLAEVLEAALVQGHDALRRTPEMLPVLAEAGVVDAGGAGFLLLLDASSTSSTAGPCPSPTWVRARSGPGPTWCTRGPPSTSTAPSPTCATRSCTSSRPPTSDPGLQGGVGRDRRLDRGGRRRRHLELPHPHRRHRRRHRGGIDIGRPRKIRVTDLLEEVEEERWVREAAARPGGRRPAEHLDEPVPTAVVAVASGDGRAPHLPLARGARVVTGGQTMNPSTAQLLRRWRTPRRPGGDPAQQQEHHPGGRAGRRPHRQGRAGGAHHRDHRGLRRPPAYDPEARPPTTPRPCRRVRRRARRRGHQAVRDSTCEVGPIADRRLAGHRPRRHPRRGVRPGRRRHRPARHLVGDEHEIVTIIEGEGASAGATRRITEWLDEHRPGAGPRCTTAASRSTPTSSASSSRLPA
jgi:uncharacterized protein